jgi:hypothetical protein
VHAHIIWPLLLTYCINLGLFSEQKDGAKLYPSVIFKALKSPRVTLSRKKIKRDPTVIDTISITAEVAYRVTNTLTNEGPHQALPQDYWGFIPHDHDQLPQPNVTKILLSPHQVSVSYQFVSLFCIGFQSKFDSAAKLSPVSFLF